jgi:hypothetical protein
MRAKAVGAEHLLPGHPVDREGAALKVDRRTPSSSISSSPQASVQLGIFVS